MGMKFLRDVAKATCVVDPFCGHGTALAMGNALGMSAIGVEISRRRCKRAERLNLTNRLDLVSKAMRTIAWDVGSAKDDSFGAAATTNSDSTTASCINANINSSSIDLAKKKKKGGSRDKFYN